MAQQGIREGHRLNLPCPIERTLTVNGDECECLIFWTLDISETTEIESVIRSNDGAEVILEVDPGELQNVQQYAEYWLNRN